MLNNFVFDLKPIGIPFGSKVNGKLYAQSDYLKLTRNRNTSLCLQFVTEFPQKQRWSEHKWRNCSAQVA